MEQFTDSNPFDFKNIGVIKAYRVMVVDHILNIKKNRKINYYRLKYLPFMDIDGNISRVSGRAIDIVKTKGPNNPDRFITVDPNKYLHISSPTLIPIGTEMFINTIQLDRTGELLFNIVWLSKYTKENMPTVNRALAVKNKLKIFIGSNYALKDVDNNRPVVVFPGNLSLNNIVFEDKCYDNIKPKLKVTGYMLKSLINKTSYMVYRYFVSKANKLQLFTKDIIDKRVLSKILIGRPIIPENTSHIEIIGKHIDVTCKAIINTKGIRKYKDVIKSYEMEIAPDDRHGPFHVFTSYMLAKIYGEDWLDLTYDDSQCDEEYE